jgi:hypothetical protein
MIWDPERSGLPAQRFDVSVDTAPVPDRHEQSASRPLKI